MKERKAQQEQHRERDAHPEEIKDLTVELHELFGELHELAEELDYKWVPKTKWISSVTYLSFSEKDSEKNGDWAVLREIIRPKLYAAVRIFPKVYLAWSPEKRVPMVVTFRDNGKVLVAPIVFRLFTKEGKPRPLEPFQYKKSRRLARARLANVRDWAARMVTSLDKLAERRVVEEERNPDKRS